MKKNKEENLTNEITHTLKLIVIITFILLIIAMAIFGAYFGINLTPVSESDTTEITFTVEEGWTTNKVLEELEKEDLIKSDTAAKIYLKTQSSVSIKAGTYTLNKTMTLDDILNTLSDGSKAKSDDITLTLVEGKKYPYYMEKIASSFNLDKDEIIKYTSTSEYLDKVIAKYWFIDDSVKNENLYYPLEGYIYPDTYSFKKDATIDDIMDKLLSTMQTKLENYKTDIENSGKSIHSLLTMASMVELEAVTEEDRLNVAGVFYNRINAGIAMGSDVTTYYAAKKEMTESLYVSEINMCNAYNTRGTCAVSFPVGPIASPSLTSIKAAINPNKNDYLYFVADKNNKVYFSKTNDEQLKVIADLKNKNLWPE